MVCNAPGCKINSVSRCSRRRAKAEIAKTEIILTEPNHDDEKNILLTANNPIETPSHIQRSVLYQIVFMAFHVAAKKQFPISVGLSCHRLLYDFWIRRDKDPGFPVATTSG